jgi:hypothetical protein
MFVPLAPAAAQNLGVGLRERCRGKPCDGMLGAMVHIAGATVHISFRRTVVPWLDSLLIRQFDSNSKRGLG